MNSKTRFFLAVFGLLFAASAWSITHKSETPEEKQAEAQEERTEIQNMRTETLAQLYEEEAGAKGQIANAAGYAVFSNFGMNLFLLSTGNGAGVAHYNSNGNDVYMKMYSAGAGIGLGVKTFRAIFIFHTKDALNMFVEEGWDFSGQADAAATTDADDKGEAGAADMAATATKGVTVYQLTDKGLALQATLQGTKYWKDDDLN